jgi:hypothetical protein
MLGYVVLGGMRMGWYAAGAFFRMLRVLAEWSRVILFLTIWLLSGADLAYKKTYARFIKSRKKF